MKIRVKLINLRKINILYTVMFLLGTFASLQLFSICGVTIFNILLVGSIILLFLEVKINKLSIYFCISLFATILTIIISMANKLPQDFMHAAFISGVTYILILIIYNYMSNDLIVTQAFFKGMDLTCKLTLYWSVMQILMYRLIGCDINQILFNGILKIDGKVSDFIDGNLIPTGFFYHRGILIPLLIYYYFRTSNFIEKILIIIVALMSKSTAASLGIGMAVFFNCLFKIKKIICEKNIYIERKKIFLICIAMVLCGMAFIMLVPKFQEIIIYLITRITDVTSNKADNSSVTHFMYYKNLGEILENVKVVHLIFGNGFSTSGYQYVLLNGQYADLGAWVVESDFINILLSQGLIGFILWLFIPIKMILLSIKERYYENICFIIIILFVGVMYNVQFTWFILLELTLLVQLDNKNKVFDFGKNSSERT